MSINQQFNHRAVLNVILWGVIIPQLLLIALNLRSWGLISGEASQSEASYALITFVLELGLVIVASLVFWLLLTKKVPLGWRIALGSLFAHALYMIFFLYSINHIVPNSIQPWILNEENVGRWNITLLMPGAFLSLYALTRSFFSKFNGTKGKVFVLLTMFGMPVVWYLFVSLLQPFLSGQLTVIISALLGVLMVTVFLGTIIHFFDNMLHKPSTTTYVGKHYIVAILLGLAAPLGGLVLNHKVPFPVDFQSIGVYALTVFNGLILITKPEGQKYSSIRLFLRFLVFPFTLYFFFVFLPFLPLSLFAIIVVGAGFLMLTPLALGLYQTKITYSEYSLTKAKLGASKAILISVLGLTVLPSYFLMQAVMDENALNTSLEYFYSHDVAAERLSESQISRSADALVQLRDRKKGIQLPYVSAMYNAVVFGDLVLTDKKIARMYQLLTGMQLPKASESVFGTRGSSRRGFEWQQGVIAPKREVEIKAITLNEKIKGESTVNLVLQNHSENTHSLFVGQLDIPEGVFISGLRLKIEGEWVTGRVFDKKTALWVFQKITEVRRDPALLYYLSSKQAELRVYPFPNKGVREVEIDFQYHPNIDSKITISGQKIDLNPTFNSASIVSRSGETLLRDNISKLAFQRTPYIHFILDYSGNVSTKNREYAERINKVRAKLNIPEFRVTAANIAVSKNSDDELLDAIDVEALSHHISTIKLPKAGGLWIQQALAKEILHAKETINQESFKRTPVFVVLSNQEFGSSEDLKLEPWAWLIPDLKGWYSYSANKLQFHAFSGTDHNTLNHDIALNPIIAIKHGTEISILPANRSSILDASKRNPPINNRGFK